MALLVLQDQLVYLVLQDLKEMLEEQVKKEKVVLLAKMVQQDQQDLLVNVDCLAAMDHLASKDLEATLVTEGLMASLEFLVSMV